MQLRHTITQHKAIPCGSSSCSNDISASTELSILPYVLSEVVVLGDILIRFTSFVLLCKDSGGVVGGDRACLDWRVACHIVVSFVCVMKHLQQLCYLEASL